MTRVFADTSYWFSLAVRADANHRRTAKMTLRLQESGVLLHASTLVAAETHRLLLHKIGITAGRRFLDQLALQEEKGFIRILPVDWSVLEKARRILGQYVDQRISLTDASSAVLMHENRMSMAASYDRHFEVMGFERIPSAITDPD